MNSLQIKVYLASITAKYTLIPPNSRELKNIVIGNNKMLPLSQNEQQELYTFIFFKKSHSGR